MKDVTQQVNIVEPSYFSNWADLFMPKIANKILPLILPLSFITPNGITVFSFLLYTVACISLFLEYPYHLYWSAVLLPIAYILDCLDGQLARTRKQFSPIGDYLDKTLDVLKIYVISLSLALSMYLQTFNVLYIFLGFTACFFFNFRYYIKLETMFSAINKDSEYMKKSTEYRKNQYEILSKKYHNLSQSFLGKVQIFWYKNRTIVFVDEAEFVVFTSIAALLGRIEIALWIFAISQPIIAFWRLYERGYQLQKAPEQLIRPMRK